jgi:RimJ/RimL family protein N-acetyltransferase
MGPGEEPMGKGLAQGAVRKILAFAFQELDLKLS